MVAAHKRLIWVILASAALAAPAGFFLGQGLVGSASSAGLSGAAAEASEDGAQDDEVVAALELAQTPGEVATALEGVDAEPTVLHDSEGINIVPDVKLPEALVEDCKSHLRRGAESPEQADQVFSCKALLLADEGKIAPGQYTNDEMENLVESQEPNVELQR